MEKRKHKAVTNEKNPKDHNTRAGHTVQDSKHKGKIASPMPRQKRMERGSGAKIKGTK